jgi:hypothetical protein
MEEDTIQYNRPTTYDNTKQIKHRRFQTESYELLDEKYKEHTKVSRKDRRLTCTIVTPECKIRTRMRNQNTIYICSAKQEAIIKAIWTARKSNKKRVSIERNGDTKNQKN